MKCPHCLVAFHDRPKTTGLDQDIDGWWGVVSRRFPNCERLILSLAIFEVLFDRGQPVSRIRVAGYLFVREHPTVLLSLRTYPKSLRDTIARPA